MEYYNMSLNFDSFNIVEKTVCTNKALSEDFSKEFPILNRLGSTIAENYEADSKHKAKDLYFATDNFKSLYKEMVRYSKLASGFDECATYKLKPVKYEAAMNFFYSACLNEFGSDILYLFVPEMMKAENKFVKDEEFLKVYRKMFKEYFNKVKKYNYSSRLDTLLAALEENKENKDKQNILYEIYALFDNQMKAIYDRLKSDIEESKTGKRPVNQKTKPRTQWKNVFDTVDDLESIESLWDLFGPYKPSIFTKYW